MFFILDSSILFCFLFFTFLSLIDEFTAVLQVNTVVHLSLYCTVPPLYITEFTAYYLSPLFDLKFDWLSTALH